MASTPTEVANQALIEIKKDPVKSLDESPTNPNASTPNQKSVAIINVVYEEVVKWVQSKSKWSDLYERRVLTLVSSPTDTDRTYKYQYPEGFLGHIVLVSGQPWEKQGSLLVTQDPEAELRYVQYITDPSKWNTFLTRAIVMELAARIAPKLNVDAAEAKEIRMMADRTLIDESASDYTNRASARQKDAWYELNQAREGIGGRYPGTGRIARLRNDSVPRLNVQ